MDKELILGLYIKEKSAFKLSRFIEKGINFDNYIEEKGYSRKELISLGEEELKKAEKKRIKIVFYEENEFPEKLKKISYPPVFLYIKGKLQTEGVLIAVIGSRKPTPYGKETTGYFVEKLVKAGAGIVSGLARGIDTIAHKTCLKAGGYTIGVPGSGLDIFYPAENRSLYEKIVESGGALVSEFPFGTRPFKENFPRRNRIISGLSEGILVVEAGKKSGTLLTVKWGLSQGKEVFAIPGSIFSPQSEGTHLLLKEGATPVTTPEDILNYFGIVSEKKEKQQQGVSLSKEEKLIIEKLSSYPIHLEELIEKTELLPFEVLSAVTELEIKGIVEILPGKFIKLKTRETEI